MKKTTSYTEYLEEKIKKYNEAIRLDPNSAKAYYNRGNAKSGQNDRIFNESIE